MNKIVRFLGVVFVVFMFAMGTAYAENDAIPITAEQAFDAWANQEDPNTGGPANVAIVDMRTTAEYHWVGTCAQVETILTKRGNEINPDNGKVNLIQGGKLLKFKVSGLPKVLPVKFVEEITTSRIAINIPYETWDDDKCEKVFNDDFVAQMEALAEDNDVIIMMCRSGKRSSKPEFNFGLFMEVYEIDQPDGKNGRGGFQGTSYHDAYNGFRGFPGRKTAFQENESVSWSDAALPVHIGYCPYE